MESLLFLLKGILIGLVVGFPSGPVGFIYIKRATTDGFLAGLTSGIGSTVAHIFYAIILLFGYTEIVEVFEDGHEVLAFICSTFIIVLGIIIFFSEKKKKCKDNGETLYGYFFSALGITATNPLEIIQFSFLFSFLKIWNSNYFESVFLIIGIIAGSIFWPAISSLGISKIRHTIPEKKLVYFQRIMGIAIIIIGLLYIIKGFT